MIKPDDVLVPLEPPAEVRNRWHPWSASAGVQFSAHNFGEANRNFLRAYEILREFQPPGRRFHKGYELHNSGAALFYLNKLTDARRTTLAAYVEDVLTSPDSCLGMPAAQNLGALFGIPATALDSLRDKVRTAAMSAVDLVGDPQRLLDAINVPVCLETAFPLTERPKRQPGQFESRWQKRVFVGGSYRAARLIINEIADACREVGCDPVIESDFEVPEDEIQRFAFMLLHECKYAIFDVTTMAGQLLELAQTPAYGIKPLVLLQGSSEIDAQVSAMISTQPGVPVERCPSMEALRKSVRQYLSAPDGGS